MGEILWLSEKSKKIQLMARYMTRVICFENIIVGGNVQKVQGIQAESPFLLQVTGCIWSRLDAQERKEKPFVTFTLGEFSHILPLSMQ